MKKYVGVLITVVLMGILATACSSEEEKSSILNQEYIFGTIEKSNNVKIIFENGNELNLEDTKKFLDILKENKWEKMKVEAPYEDIANLKIKTDSFEMKFYKDTNYLYVSGSDKWVYYKASKVFQSQIIKYINEFEEKSKKSQNSSPVVANSEKVRMVMVEGQLYVDTKVISEEPRCGVLDGEISTTTKESEIPTKEGQSNFGTGYGYQISGDGIDVMIDEKWVVFKKALVDER